MHYIFILPVHKSFQTKERPVSEINKDEKVSVTNSNFNVANVIAAIALLLLVLGLLKWMGVSPI
jgi:uncharacterized membrane protein YidH (DUF202 family)